MKKILFGIGLLLITTLCFSQTANDTIVALGKSNPISDKMQEWSIKINKTVKRSLLNANDSGDVVGPASATTARIAIFNGITGKLIQDGGSTIANVLDRSNHTGTQSYSTISASGTPSSSNFLRGDGYWATPISTPPGGTDGYVQYNNGGVFGGAAALYYDDATNRLGINTSSPASLLTISASSGTIAGGLTFNTAGTVGIWRSTTNALMFANATNTISLDSDTARFEEEVIKTKDLVVTGNIVFGGITLSTPDTNQSPNLAIYRNTDLTITATQNIWYKITGFTVKKNKSMTVAGDSVQIPIGEYNVNMTISSSGLNNEVWELGVFKNGALEQPSQLRYTSTSDVGNWNCPVYISSDGDDWFAFKIRNTTDGDDPTIKRFSTIITSLDY